MSAEISEVPPSEISSGSENCARPDEHVLAASDAPVQPAPCSMLPRAHAEDAGDAPDGRPGLPGQPAAAFDPSDVAPEGSYAPEAGPGSYDPAPASPGHYSRSIADAISGPILRFAIIPSAQGSSPSVGFPPVPAGNYPRRRSTASTEPIVRFYPLGFAPRAYSRGLLVLTIPGFHRCASIWPAVTYPLGHCGSSPAS